MKVDRRAILRKITRLKSQLPPPKKRGAKPRGREVAFMDLCYAFFEAEPACWGKNRRAIITVFRKKFPDDPWLATRNARRLENMLLEGERLRRMRPPPGHVFVRRYGRLLITPK